LVKSEVITKSSIYMPVSERKVSRS